MESVVLDSLLAEREGGSVGGEFKAEETLALKYSATFHPGAAHPFWH
jgi:hypothetical protein